MAGWGQDSSLKIQYHGQPRGQWGGGGRQRRRDKDRFPAAAHNPYWPY